jgi:hypothetical protein
MHTETIAKAEPQSFNMLATSFGRIDPDQVYSRGQASLILNRTPKTLMRWEQDGIGPRVTRQTQDSPPEYRGQDLLDHLDRSRR